MLHTLIVAICAGVWITAICRKFHLPAIVLLLLGGIALGPEGAGLVQPDDLGHLLEVFVSMAAAVILFEGGLSLDWKGYQSASLVIRRLLTTGVLTTWLAIAIAIWQLFSFDFAFSLLAASLVIVTGPTVIGPILSRVHLRDNLHHILHWEAVLIDAIGVFVALMCYEAYQLEAGQIPVVNLLSRIVVGVAMGMMGGWLILSLLRWGLVPDGMTNLFALSGALLVFGISDVIMTESGILAVTVAGLVLGSQNLEVLRGIRQFKAELTDLLIGMLFILLASRLRFQQFEAFGREGAILVAVVVVLVRPLNILLSTRGSGLGIREKLFLSWMAPRGIIAASMAALFSLHLQSSGHVEDPRFLETFTFSLILTTVIMNGLFAGIVARILGVKRPARNGWVIAGAHAFARAVAGFLRDQAGVPVMLVDSNPHRVEEARAAGFSTLHADAGDVELREREEFQAMGNLLALTDNQELNELLCLRWRTMLGKSHVYQWGKAAAAKTAGAGTLVFAGFPKPSVVGMELENGVSTLSILSKVDAANLPVGAPVVALDSGAIVFPDSAERLAQRKTAQPVLWLERAFIE